MKHRFFYVQDFTSQWKNRLKCLSLPCLAVPPAESPSTKKISEISGSLEEQSDNFPGKPEPPIGDFL